MKMSKKTRILSVLLCVAVMIGIMSVGTFANAANSETPAIQWTEDIWCGGVKTVEDGFMSIDTTGHGATYMWQVGTNGGASLDNISQLHTADGAVFAIRIDSAWGNVGDVENLAANLKLFTSDGVCYNLSGLVEVGGKTTQVVLPLAEFFRDNHPDDLLPAEKFSDITNFQFEIRTDFENTYDGYPVSSLKYTVSPIYTYTGEPERIKLPGDVDETTTTAAPTTEAPTTVAPAPTTQAPAPTTVAPAPTTTVTEVKAATPAKVKKVTAKSKAKKKVKVTWKAAKNAKKYIVKYSYKKNMKKAKTKTTKKLKITLKKLKSGKKVYIQVQGVNGKVLGKLSAKKAVKVK